MRTITDLGIAKMGRKKKYCPLTIPAVGTTVEVEGATYKVMQVKDRTNADKFIIDCYIENRDVQLLVTLTSKYPFHIGGA